MSRKLKSLFSTSDSKKKKSPSATSSPSLGRPDSEDLRRLQQEEKRRSKEEVKKSKEGKSDSSDTEEEEEDTMSSPKKSVDALLRKLSKKRTSVSSSPSPSPEPEPKVPHITQLPWPVVEIIRQSENLFAMQWFIDICPMLAKLAEWTFIYSLAWLGCGYGWVVFLATAHYIKYRSNREGLADTMIAKLCTAAPEKEVIGDKMQHFPAWVVFPDFDRVEWINDILVKLWPKLAGYSTEFVVDFIQPEIMRILDRMRLESVSGFSVKKVDVGKIPARISGIKVYSRSTDRDEIVLDAEVVYSGDARVLFSLQGVKAEIKNITFKGMARITLKPLLPTFPFIGGFEFYFINTPLLEYGLGGIGTFAEIPGANAIVKTIVEDQIKSRFVWPNRFHMYLPIEVVEKISDKSYMLSKPMGVLKIELVEARDLLKKDKKLTGGGLSDPYATVKIGERKESFRDKYVANTVTPTWNYTVRFIMEDTQGQEVKIEVFDWDSASGDDFLGKTGMMMDRLVAEKDTDDWMKLEEVKKGEVHVVSNWKEATSLEDVDEEDLDNFDSHIVSFFIHACANVKSGKPPYPKCNIKHTQGGSESTAVKNKTGNPVFEEGFLFLTESVDTDNLTVEVVDSKGSDSLGRVKIPLSFLKHSPRREFFNMDWDLEDGACADASITLSAKLYGVK
jgi:hypothetical protein